MVENGIRTEPCLVCGATLSAPDGDWDAIAAMLWRHNRSSGHLGGLVESAKAALSAARRTGAQADLDAATAALRRWQRRHLKASVEEARAARSWSEAAA